MKKIKLIFLIFFCFILQNHKSAFSDDKHFHVAVGGGMAFYSVQSYGESTFTQMAPEIVAYGYYNLFQSFWLRPGIRMNYSWLQPDMPQAIRIEERDFRYLAEVGVVFDWIVVPSLSYGFGYDYRTTNFKVNAPIVSYVDDISGSEFIPFSQFQLGLGFPIFKGLILIEPYGRYTIVQNDSRYGWGYGFEVTFQVY
ncbi:hypothetical protein [Silvanigrella aquatica]|uniref:Outer membrane protein beta-barrel domain-containing protein n=1 Tax=Silvanigrella aquatica TaxID=1915309 RepID=A0A1L4D1B5_9BACT|nr:hypothetical protein [Silvanigrella aquatica]APJ03980.1 hypothetical protein AXG55_08690 [Silvanigrella aquatica]